MDNNLIDKDILYGKYIKHAEDVCKSKGDRLTDLRRAIFEILIKSEKPLRAYEIIEKMREHGKRIHAATIYRILEFLSSNGLVHRVDALNAYIACTKNHTDHPSLLFICSNCSRTAEIDDPELCGSIHKNLIKLGMSSNNDCIEVKGRCENCAIQSAMDD